MNITRLKQQARQEIENIKEFATAEELKRLNFYTFRPRSGTKCIYAQMTGSCISDRAEYLIEKCAEGMAINSIHDLEPLINTRKPRKCGFPNVGFTKLEWWIVNRPEKNEEILKFLKGEQETLEL